MASEASSHRYASSPATASFQPERPPSLPPTPPSSGPAPDTRSPRAVSTGLWSLDKLLVTAKLAQEGAAGGLERGTVTEVYGPAGVGKTAFGIQACANALRAGLDVVWVETGTPLVPQRLHSVLAATTGTAAASRLTGRFHHCRAPTLAHLLALLVLPNPQFPPPNTGLLVIDSLAPLLDDAYPRHVDPRATRATGDNAKWAAGRRFAAVHALMTALTNTAADHDIALLVASRASTRIRAGARALLVPPIPGATWEKGIPTRLALFRDWVPGQGDSSDVSAGRLRKARFAGLVKLDRGPLANEGGVGNVVPFAIEQTGLCNISVGAVDIADPDSLAIDSRPRKRRFSDVDDSEEEDLEVGEHYEYVPEDEFAAEALLFEDEEARAHGSSPGTAAVVDSVAFPEDRIPEGEGETVLPKRTAPT